MRKGNLSRTVSLIYAALNLLGVQGMGGNTITDKRDPIDLMAITLRGVAG